jgi:uncharacterized protein
MARPMRSRYENGMARWAKWLALALALVAMLGGWALWRHAERLARADPVVRQLRVEVKGWPRGAKPVRVALLSDVHIGNPAMDAARLARIVDQVNARHPDLVLFAGDFIDGHDPGNAVRFAPLLTAPLARLRAPLGTLAVPGNHDHWTGLPAVRQALEAAGVLVVGNRTVRRGPLAILAVDDSFTGYADVARTAAEARALGGVPVALMHALVPLDTLPGNVRLVLTGHTHCGQVVVPVLGALAEWRPRKHRLYDPRYRCGLIRSGERTVLVAAGLGTSASPVRLGAPPDFWLVTLGPAQGGARR